MFLLSCSLIVYWLTNVCGAEGCAGSYGANKFKGCTSVNSSGFICGSFICLVIGCRCEAGAKLPLLLGSESASIGLLSLNVFPPITSL